MLMNAKVVDGNLRCLRARSESGSSTASPCKQRHSPGNMAAGQGWKTKPDLFHCPLATQSCVEKRLRKKCCNERIYLQNYSVRNVTQIAHSCNELRTAISLAQLHFVCLVLSLCTTETTLGVSWIYSSYYLLKSLAVEVQECSRKVSH